MLSNHWGPLSFGLNLGSLERSHSIENKGINLCGKERHCVRNWRRMAHSCCSTKKSWRADRTEDLSNALFGVGRGGRQNLD
jgi:hypothetical protein